MKTSWKNSGLLLLTALIWGSAFVVQKEGMNYLEPFAYNAVRNVVGAFFLLLLLPALDKLRASRGGFEKGNRRDVLIGGVLCGVVLFFASNFQQFGIALQSPDTNVGKAGFITAIYCAFVPVIGLVFKKRSPWLVWAGVAVAVVGFFFLCLMDGVAAGQGLGLEKSDLLLLACSLCFAVHIMVIDHYSPLADGVRLSCIQFFVCGALCFVCAFIWEDPKMMDVIACWRHILYAGVMSSGVAYTLQIIAQKGVHPAVASLLLSLESVFSVLAGYVFMPESGLSAWELLGCGLVFAAVVMVQLAPQQKPEML